MRRGVAGRYSGRGWMRQRDRGPLVDFAGAVDAVYVCSMWAREQGCKRVSSRRIGHVIPHVAMLLRSFAVQIALGLHNESPERTRIEVNQASRRA